MLEVSNLVRSYGDLIAVDHVSFSIPPGQIVGLLGHNGAGKTTIMKVLSGYLEPDQGSVRVEGVDIGEKLNDFQKSLGYLPENLPIYHDMVVIDYLDYAADLKHIPAKQKRSELKRVIHETGIKEKVFSPISSLSRGYRQRVGVAQAILGNPRLLILDEPTNGLDPSQTEQMRLLIKEVSKKATVLLSTHIMQEVEALCTRVLILDKGRLAVDADLDDLARSRELLVITDLEPGAMRNLTGDLSELEELTVGDKHGDRREYRLALQDETDSSELSAKLVSTITENKGRIYQISPVKADLESLVRSVAQGRVKEVDHAA